MGPESVGRRNPDEDAATDTRSPKYLNTGQTALYTKGQHLYGLVENTATLSHGGLAVLVEGPVDALAVDLASGGMMAGVAPLGTALTGIQAGQIRDALSAGSDRVVVATDPDPAGAQAARRAYQLLTAQQLDPCGAVLPESMDPAQTAELHGPAALVDRLATAEPMGRQLAEQALAGRDLTWPENRVSAARVAAGIIAAAPPNTWNREIEAVADRIGLDMTTLRSAVVDTIDTDTDALGRLTARDQRDDLNRGQHVAASPAQLAAMSAPRATTARPADSPRADTAPLVQAAAVARNPVRQ